MTTYPLAQHRAYAVMECTACRREVAVMCSLRSEGGVDIESRWFVSGATRLMRVAHVDCPRCASGAVSVVGIDAMTSQRTQWDVSDRLVVGTVSYDGQHVSVYLECADCSPRGGVFVIRMAPTDDGVAITVELGGM